MVYVLQPSFPSYEKWQIAYADDAITLEELHAHAADDKAKKELLKEELGKIHRKPRVQWSKQEVIEQLSQFHSIWEVIEDEYAKKGFLNEVFESLTINTDVVKVIGDPGHSVPVYVEDCVFNE